METSSRDRISVDLHGLKAMLVERSRALALSPSELVRKVLVKELAVWQALRACLTAAIWRGRWALERACVCACTGTVWRQRWKQRAGQA